MSSTLAPPRHSARHPLPAPHPEVVTETPVAKTTTNEIYEAFDLANFTWRKIDWVTIIFLTVVHVGSLFAPFYFSWSALAAAIVLHWATGSLGICLGYHRCLSHRSLKLKGPARFMTLLCGSLSAEGSPMTWAATHRLHHSRSDQHGDPHSPMDGPWWSHILWLGMVRSTEMKKKLFQRYIPDLLQDRMLNFFEKTYGWWLLVSAVVLTAIGGIPWLVWAFCLRTVLMYHSTWFVNSATHLWGYRNYVTRDQSRNLWWVAILAYGEGWHNNHHAHPALARAGHRPWELDPTYWAISFLRLIGQAYDVDDRIPVVGAISTEDNI